MGNEPLFSAAPFFLVRSTIFPFKQFFETVSIQIFHNDSLVREAIAIASPSLYQALLDFEKKDSKQQELIISSFSNYIARMSTRSTPFGLFSFLSSGSWNTKANVFFDLGKVYKRARPDMGWINQVCEALLSDLSFFSSLRILKNPLIQESGMRFYLNYFRKNKEEDASPIRSIRSTFLIKAIFKITKKPISIADLTKSILDEYDFLETDKILIFLKQLIDLQFLQLDLLPSAIEDSFFSKMVKTLCSISPKMSKTFTEIEQYSQSPLGSGEQDLNKLQQKMENTCKADNYLQVDSFYKASAHTLPKHVAQELTTSLEILWKIAHCYSSFSFLRSYHSKFLEKYGTFQSVPILELFNEDIGLGIPETYFGMENRRIKEPATSQETEWKQWLKNAWISCIHEHREEIEITQEIIDKIIKETNKSKAILSFEVNCQIISNSQLDVDENNYLIQLLYLSWQAGNTFGRFIHDLGEKTKEDLREFLKKEELLEPESIIATATYPPSLPRDFNVTICPQFRQNVIDLSKNETISTEHISVGATLDRLYLIDENSGKELIVVQNHMLNPGFAPHILRFMLDVSKAKYQPIQEFDWGELKDNCFLPRVRFEKTIFSPSEWKVDLGLLNLSKDDSLEKIKNQFQAWAELWKMPRFVYFAQSDQRLFIDRTYPPHLEQVINQVKKGTKVRLIEKIGQENGQWTQSQKGKHTCEFTIPFMKNENYIAQIDCIPLKSSLISNELRLKLPGSNWFYAKFYLRESNENEFLSKQCLEFTENLVDKKILSSWFFIRYSDQNPHLRLRFCIQDPSFLIYFHNWTQFLLDNHFINTMTINPYEREIERYGGVDLIEDAETVFCKDSLTTLELLKHTNTIPLVALLPLSLIDFLKNLGMEIEDQISFFSNQDLPRELLSGFREHKNLILSYSRSILQGTEHPLSMAFEIRKNALKTFASKVKKDRATIFSSLLHMHCNRLIGKEAEKEKKARIYCYHSLKTISCQLTFSSSI